MIILNETEKNKNVDEISLEDRLVALFDFARNADDVVRDGAVPHENCALEPGSVEDLKRRLGQTRPWEKTYLCGNAWPDAYSIETAAASYGYDELDAGSPPENDDERDYLADRRKWYENYLDNRLWDGMPEKAFGVELKADPFILRAKRPNGEGVALACRIITFW